MVRTRGTGPQPPVGRVTGRARAVLLLFAMTLLLLLAGRLIIIPNPSGESDPQGAFTLLALASTMATLVVAVVERPTRLLLAALVAGLFAALLALSLLGVQYRFLWQSDEGESSMMLIALAAAAAILATTASIRPLAAPRDRHAPARLPGRGVGAYARRALWSTSARRTMLLLLVAFYVLLPAVLAATTDETELTSSAGGIVPAAVAVFCGYLASRVASQPLAATLWAVALLSALLASVLLGIFPLLLHALTAVGAFVASAAAEDARTRGAKLGFSTLAIVAVLAWIVLLLYGLLFVALVESGGLN
jgi:hypothetical protein